MAAAYLTPCYSLNGFIECFPGCVTLATRLYLSVALGGTEYIHIFEETVILFYLARTTVT